MSPLISRRRSRRRSASGRNILLIGALVVTAVLIGGLTRVDRQSGPYDASVNRSFAAQGSVLAEESDTTSADVRSLLSHMQTDDRATLQAALDSVVLQTSQQAARANALGVPHTPGDPGKELTVALTDRADAVNQVRSAIDGLLGMHPLPVAGTSLDGATGAQSPTLLSATEATDRIAGAGELLARSDSAYDAARRALAGAAGHARIPASVWIINAQEWQLGSVATQVDLAASSTSLAATHLLVLRTVRLNPGALPSPSGKPSPGLSVLSPTKQVEVSVVLSNLGSVDEPHASVQFALTLQPSGLTTTVTRSAAIASAGSATLEPAYFRVKPGDSYRLTVSIVLPPAQTSVTGSSLTEVLQIAPST